MRLWDRLFSPSRQLKALNARLQATVVEQARTAALLRDSEAQVRAVNAELERRVTERTADLSAANARLVEALSERTTAEAALRDGETRLRLAVDAAQMGVWEMDFVRNMGRLDDRAAGMSGGGLPAETWIPLDGREFSAWAANIHPDDIPVRAEAARAIREGARQVVQMEYRVMRAGSWAWLTHWRLVVEHDPATGKPLRAIGVIQDTTGRALVEANLREAVTQRDLLLREVYHRVKNNLQIVDGLLMMQARGLEDPRAVQALTDLRARVYALGLVHAQLMASKNLETFDISPFLQELIHNVAAGAGQPMEVAVEACSLEVNLDFAVPVGLLATELVTNCLKHALAGGSGAVRVSLALGREGEAVLIVAGDGPTARTETPPGVGASIVAGLVRQLSATISVDDGVGRTTTIVIPASEFA